MRPLAASPLALGLLVAASAAASDLSWSGPAECRQSEQLTFQVERALGAPLAEVGQVHLQVHIEQLEPDARALLRIAESTGGATGVKKRLLTAPDCTALVDTLSVAIALALEAVQDASSASKLAAPSVAAPAVLAPVVLASSEPRITSDAVSSASVPSAERAARPVPRVVALLVGDTGSLPAPALGVSVGAALGGERWQLELLGTLWLEQHRSLQNSIGAGAGADLTLVTAALLGCALPWRADQLSASFCAGVELGRLAGEGTGVSSPRRPDALWLAPGLHAGLSWQVPRTQLSLGARVGVVLPLQRHEFVLEGLGTVYQPANLAARAALGMALALD